MSEDRPTLEEALAALDPESERERLEKAEEQRREAVGRFPLDAWPRLPLERYAIGHRLAGESFSAWMERRTPHLGSIRGGLPGKFLIYKTSNDGWRFDPSFKNEHRAWDRIRGAFVQAFRYAGTGDWEAIDALTPLRPGPLILLKALHLYFPDAILPVYPTRHLAHYLSLLAAPAPGPKAPGPVALNRALLAAAREVPALSGRSPLEIAHALHAWVDPRLTHRVLAVSPGERARLWRECLREGFICAPWDETGSLGEFKSKKAFLERFEREFGEEYGGNHAQLVERAGDLWSLRELEPGDTVVARRGDSRVLAVGEVVEPGYEFRPERPEHRHTVRVRWDTSLAREVEPQSTWGEGAITRVGPALYESLVREAAPVDSPDPLYSEIAEALDRKGQVILHGPPGTGKTFTARRIAVAWLAERNGFDALDTLSDAGRFEQIEQELTSPNSGRRVWWVVANPKEWTWDRLFAEGEVRYRYGRLKKNFSLVRPGDLVIGYESAPTKRVVALARVTATFGVHEGGTPTVALAPLAQVRNGPSYDDLTINPTLSASEPMRFRNQGTLFSLSGDEAEHALALLAERDPGVEAAVETSAGVGQLTRLTFHPSYSYEDFVEGFRPVEGGTGALSLRLEDGVFKRVCREAGAHPDRPYLVLVDEINRANLARVFGDLITLLEPDKRGLALTLPQSRQRFAIPPNVFLLGTMNSADRSIKIFDAAIRRRFAFVEMMPNPGLLAGARAGPLALDRFLSELNRRIVRGHGREKQIGHAFLMDADGPVTDPAELARRFRQEILPLLEEYCYDDYPALAGLVGTALVDGEAQSVDHDLLANPARLLRVLAEEFGR